MDLGVVKLDLNGGMMTDQTSLFVTKNVGNMKDFDLGLSLEVGNGSANKFFGKGFQFNIGLGGNVTGRFPIEMNSTNPGGNFFNSLSDHTFSGEVGPGGGVHYGEVITKPLFNF